MHQGVPRAKFLTERGRESGYFRARDRLRALAPTEGHTAARISGNPASCYTCRAGEGRWRAGRRRDDRACSTGVVCSLRGDMHSRLGCHEGAAASCELSRLAATRWAEPLRRGLLIELLACPRHGGPICCWLRFGIRLDPGGSGLPGPPSEVRGCRVRGHRCGRRSGARGVARQRSRDAPRDGGVVGSFRDLNQCITPPTGRAT